MKVWDASSGEGMSTLEGHVRSVSSVCMSADGLRIVSVSRDRTVKVWDASSGECMSTLEGGADSKNNGA